ncbi:MAG: tetratricopeptide repeat protein [Myxococcales bacterium]|nr:tetratricopeptide repeat protein [Myxococcales bacterium]
MPPNPNDSAKVAVLRARQLLKDKRYSDALQVVTDELARGNDHPELRLVAAHSLLAQGRHEGAKKEAQQVVRLDPGQAEAFRILADVACARGEIASACEHLERVVELQPDDARSRSLLDTLSRPSALPPPSNEDTVPIPAAMQIKVRAASLDRFILGEESAVARIDEDDDLLGDVGSLPEFQISDSMMEELPAVPREDDDLIAEVSDSMMEELPSEPEDLGTEELSDSMIEVVSANREPAPGLSTLHDPPKDKAAGWRPQSDAGAGVGQKYQGTLRLPALDDLPGEEDAPTMPLLRPSAPKEPQLKLDPLAKKPVSHEPVSEATRPVPRSGEVLTTGGGGGGGFGNLPGLGVTGPPVSGRLDDDDDDDFEDFDVEPASRPLGRPEPQPIPQSAPDPRAQKLDAASLQVDENADDEVDFGDSGEVDFGPASSEVDFGPASSEVDFGPASDPSIRIHHGGGGGGGGGGAQSDDPLMAMMTGGGGMADDSMPAINAERKTRKARKASPAPEPWDEGGAPEDFAAGPGAEMDPYEAEMAAAGIGSAKRKKKGRGKFWVVFLLLLLGGGGGAGYFLYQRHKYIQGQWSELRSAIHMSTPVGFKKAKAAAKKILEKKSGDPSARAALAVCAAATSIEFGEDRIADAKKLIDATKGKESEWRKAARGYLMLMESPHKAAGYFRAAGETFPKSAILKYLHGRALALAGEIPEAGKAYQGALKLAPGYIGARIQLAVLLGTQDSGYERGAAALTEILGKHPKNIQALIERARLGARHGKDLRRARDDAEKVANQLAEKAGRGQIGWAQLVLSQVARRLGDVGRMSGALDAAIKAPPCCDAEYRYELAHELMVLFRRHEALAQMRAALSLNGERPSYLQRMARLLLDMGKAAAAEKYINKAPARAPETKLLAGRLALARNKLKEASAKLEEAARDSAKLKAEATIYLAYVEARRRNYAAAIKRVNTLFAKQAKNYKLPQALGQIYYWSGDYKKAETALRTAWKLNGLDPQTPTLLGWVSLQEHNMLSAQKRFRTALKRRADFAPAHIGLARLRIATGRIDEARKQLSSLQTADKDRADYLATLAKVDLASGQLSEAEQNITRAEGAGAPASELAFLKGELLLKKGDPKQAVAFLKKAKKSLPKDADLLVLLGKAQFAARRTDDAYDTFQAAIKQDPGHPEGLLELGLIAVKDSELNLAVRRCKEALAKIKERQLPDSMRARAFTALGRAYLKKKDTGRAIANFQDAIKLDPQAAQPNYHMGRTYDRLDRPETSAKFYETALQLDPKLVMAHLRAGKAYLKAKNKAKAAEHLAAAIKAAPGSRAAREAQGLIRQAQ